MKAFIFASLLAMWASQSSAFTLKHDSIVSQRSCFGGPFASYDVWYAFLEKQNARKAKDAAALKTRMEKVSEVFPRAVFERRQQNLHCVDFIYKVGEEEVKGYLLMPKQAKKLPVIIKNRGGNSSFGVPNFGSLMLDHMPLAEQGFVVVASLYRGSRFPRIKEDKKDQFGGADVQGCGGIDGYC